MGDEFSVGFSQNVVILDNFSFEGFFERDTDEQKWVPLDNSRNIIDEWKLDFPIGLMVKGFKEIIIDEDESYQGEVWFIGELE